MDQRVLGKDGPKVPVICFGAWPIGGGMGRVDVNQAVATVQAALDCGMTFIDTAEGYQTSESVLGKALRKRRHEVVLATKLSGSDHSETHMRNAIENSLTVLGTDYIDLYQLHSPQSHWPIEETMGGLLRLKEEGKIRYIGISNYSPDQTQEVMSHGPVQSSQPRYNMIFRHDEENTLKFCLDSDIGVIPHSVLAKGLLGGRYKPGDTFPADDERRLFNFFRGKLFEQIYDVTTKLDEWAHDRGRDIVQLAVAWVIAHPAVTSAIVGMKDPEQVSQVSMAADWKLSALELEEIDRIIGDLQPRWKKDAFI